MYVHIRAIYVHILQCTYNILHVRMLYGVCRMLHVYIRIIENIRAYKAHCICNYTCTYTCIYGVSGSPMKSADAHFFCILCMQTLCTLKNVGSNSVHLVCSCTLFADIICRLFADPRVQAKIVCIKSAYAYFMQNDCIQYVYFLHAIESISYLDYANSVFEQ